MPTASPAGFGRVRMPDAALSQDQEWCEVELDGRLQRIRFHDYGAIFRVRGLYEHLFYERLECSSPERVAALLEDVLADFEDDPSDLAVLDLGAGNGMVGERLQELGAKRLVGIDIEREAAAAARRDRPGVYDDYVVADLAELPPDDEARLRRARLNCLASVAALGFGDVPPLAFARALDLIATPGWAAFNIKEDFLRERDDSGFARLVRELFRDEVLQVQVCRRYRHRLSIHGQPLHYVAFVARKLRPVPRRHLADPAAS